MEKFWTNFEKYFLLQKIKNGKFWKNLLEFVESGIFFGKIKKCEKTDNFW